MFRSAALEYTTTTYGYAVTIAAWRLSGKTRAQPLARSAAASRRAIYPRPSRKTRHLDSPAAAAVAADVRQPARLVSSSLSEGTNAVRKRRVPTPLQGETMVGGFLKARSHELTDCYGWSKKVESVFDQTFQ